MFNLLIRVLRALQASWLFELCRLGDFKVCLKRDMGPGVLNFHEEFAALRNSNYHSFKASTQGGVLGGSGPSGFRIYGFEVEGFQGAGTVVSGCKVQGLGFLGLGLRGLGTVQGSGLA